MGVHVSLVRYDGKKRIRDVKEWDCLRHVGDQEFFTRLKVSGMCDVMWIDVDREPLFRPNFFTPRSTTSAMLEWAENEIGTNMDRWELALNILRANPDVWVEVSR